MQKQKLDCPEVKNITKSIWCMCIYLLRCPKRQRRWLWLHFKTSRGRFSIPESVKPDIFKKVDLGQSPPLVFFLSLSGALKVQLCCFCHCLSRSFRCQRVCCFCRGSGLCTGSPCPPSRPCSSPKQARAQAPRTGPCLRRMTGKGRWGGRPAVRSLNTEDSV